VPKRDLHSVISRNLKLGGIDKCLRKARIYIKKTERNRINYNELGGVVSQLVEGGGPYFF